MLKLEYGFPLIVLFLLFLVNSLVPSTFPLNLSVHNSSLFCDTHTISCSWSPIFLPRSFALSLLLEVVWSRGQEFVPNQEHESLFNNKFLSYLTLVNQNVGEEKQSLFFFFFIWVIVKRKNLKNYFFFWIPDSFMSCMSRPCLWEC